VAPHFFAPAYICTYKAPIKSSERVTQLDISSFRAKSIRKTTRSSLFRTVQLVRLRTFCESNGVLLLELNRILANGKGLQPFLVQISLRTTLLDNCWPNAISYPYQLSKRRALSSGMILSVVLKNLDCPFPLIPISHGDQQTTSFPGCCHQ
jgi:hypothetical protein